VAVSSSVTVLSMRIISSSRAAVAISSACCLAASEAALSVAMNWLKKSLMPSIMFLCVL
jgi:hypothetical protein